MTSPARTEVLIVGAGPTGLVLALWLKRRGVAVRIIDKTATAGTTSRALAVHARTLELYRQLGIAEEIVSAGIELAAIDLWVHGARAARVAFGDIGRGLSPFPFILMLPQDQHEELLLAQLGRVGVDVERRTELLWAECAERGVSLHAFAWQPRMEKVGLARNAAYLVRPDGYVALAEPGARPHTLARFIEARGLRLDGRGSG